MGAKQKVEIARRAIEARVKRKLLAEGEMLRKVRGGYLTIDIEGNFVVKQGYGLEQLADELGALKAWEVIQAE